MRGKQILVGVTGSIAAYKAVEIVRLLQKRGASVRVAMTEVAQKFIGPLTFQAITGTPVLTDLFEVGPGRTEIEHVERAHEVDLVLVAPATANAIAKFASGLADDPIAATLLATKAPVLVAPAMESGMWTHPATIDNVARLRSRGVAFVDPEEGDLASGRSGVGRLADPERVVAAAEVVLGVNAAGTRLSDVARLAGSGSQDGAARDLDGAFVLVTAGPTWEPIDPVRVLTNRSTGAMGIAVARRAAARGAEVVLILGPTHLSPPPGLAAVHRVETAREMLVAAEEWAERANVFIAAAAVSDFRPSATHATKLKRSAAAARALELVENPDVLATLSRRLAGRALIVGFAAETDHIEAHAREKLVKKGCDLVVANRVGPTAGFGERETEVAVLRAAGDTLAFGPASKDSVADFVLDQVGLLLGQRS